MNSSSSGKSSERFFMGKGFYIVLFLCAAVIGVSAWVMATGNEAMKQSDMTDMMSGSHRVETVIAPDREKDDWIDETELAPPEIREQTPPTPAAEEEKPKPAAAEISYVWPVAGEIDRGYSVSTLHYDATMNDWRTHSGIDIAAEEGVSVVAARGGQITNVESDGLYGTVVTIDHGDGMSSVYANLGEETPLSAGQWVDAGVVIGTVGRSALGEISQEPHLHFELKRSGASVDPTVYLPG